MRTSFKTVLIYLFYTSILAIDCGEKIGIDKKLFATQEIYSCKDLVSSTGEKKISNLSYVCIQKLYSRNLVEQKDRLFVALNLNDDFIIEDEGFGDLELSFYAKKDDKGSLLSGVDLSRGTPEDKFIIKSDGKTLFISKNIDELTKSYSGEFKCSLTEIKYQI